MSIAPLPTPLQHLGGRRFSFYPPIRNLEPNEWLYRRATWSECVVANARSGEEVWIPRIFLGEVSRMDEQVMIVGLNRELEFRRGVIIPRERRVIEFPAAVRMAVNETNNDSNVVTRPHHLAPVINIRLETKPESRTWRWIGVAAVLSAVAFTIVADVARQSQIHQRGDTFRGYRAYLQLGPDDDYTSTVRKLGVPSSVSSGEAAGRNFRSLAFAARHYSVILMGASQPGAHYVGTLDQHGRILDAVRFRDGSTAESLLNSLATARSSLRSVPAF
jgi:hypothetical protein